MSDHVYLRPFREWLVLSISLFQCLEPTSPGLLAQTNPPSGPPGGGPTLALDKLYGLLEDSYKALRALESDIPMAELRKAACVVVFPASPKAAFIVGRSDTRGVISCRSGTHFNGSWSAPAVISAAGSGNGLGAGTPDAVLLVLNRDVASSILSGQARIGANTSAADILAIKGPDGSFAGASRPDITLSPDRSANKALYPEKGDALQIAQEPASGASGERNRIPRLLGQLP